MESSNGAGPEGDPSLLVVDDNQQIRELLVSALQPEGFCCIETAEGAVQARRRLEERSFDVVITDILMPDGDGIELMQWASDHCPGASWMVLTGNATVDTAVRALQLGAFDFITKPLDSLAHLRTTVRHALEHRRLVAERDGLIVELRDRNAQLATHVERLKAACSMLDEHAETIRADLCRAAFIQQALLPRKAPQLANHQIHAVYRPSENVAGDLYDVVRLDDRHLVLTVADAAGHGLSAAMLAVLFRNRLPMENPESGEILRPCETLRAVNRSLGRGQVACTTLRAYEDHRYQQILYRLLHYLAAQPSSDQLLGVGILGYSPFVGQRHGLGIEATAGLALRAACDVNGERLQQAEKKLLRLKGAPAPTFFSVTIVGRLPPIVPRRLLYTLQCSRPFLMISIRNLTNICTTGLAA